jgi:hypothetical protein
MQAFPAKSAGRHLSVACPNGTVHEKIVSISETSGQIIELTVPWQNASYDSERNVMYMAFSICLLENFCWKLQID